VIAALSAWHQQHDAASAALEEVDVLPAHVLIEAYSVLTRLPSGLAVPPALAVKVLGRRFDQPPLRLGDAERGRVLDTLADAGVLGGASYDGLVALEAKAHARTLITLDERAQATYRRLGAEFTAIVE
jgi:hypothetical protein